MSLAIERQAVWLIELRSGRLAAVAGETRRSVPRDRDDPPGLAVDPPDTVIIGVRQIEISLGIAYDIEWLVEPCAVGRAAVAVVTTLTGPHDARDRGIGRNHETNSNKKANTI